MHPAKSVFLLVGAGILSIILMNFASAQTTYNQSLERGLTYLENSEGSVWNATDTGAIYILKKEFPNTFTLASQRIDSKKIFEFDIYPYTTHLLDGQVAIPSEFEVNLGTPQLLYRIGRCEEFSLPELVTLGDSTNSTVNLYRATHAVLVLNLIQRQYGPNCGSAGIATRARAQMLRAINGLTLTNTNREHFDAWLEQECARSIATGIAPSVTTLDFVVSKQDTNSLEPRTFGGWWQYQNSVNEHVGDYDGEGNYLGELYWELPNGHTTAFALCLIAKGVGAT